MAKRILLLGGSHAQLPMILQAHEMGVEVVCVDMYPDAYCREYADIFENVSTLDYQGLKSVIEKYKVDGITTCSSDRPIPVIAQLCSEFNLVSISYNAALNATNKFRMRERLKDMHVNMPKYHLINSYKDLLVNYESLGFPFILKPTDNSGSRGVVLVNNFAELQQQYTYASEFANNKQLLIEEYMIGDEISVEGFVINNQVKIVQITDKQTTGAPHFVEIGHSQPSKYRNKLYVKLESQLQSIVEGLCIDKGPFHAEFIIKDDIAKLVEIGARLGGDNITTTLVPQSTGVNMVEATINYALGNIIDIAPKFSRGVAINFIQDYQTYINAKSFLASIIDDDFVVEVFLENNVKAKNYSLTNSAERFGYIICKGNNEQDALDKLRVIMGSLGERSEYDN